MGVGAKIPEAERPPVATLERFLQVRDIWRERFMMDLQNDCECPIEIYDAPSTGEGVRLVYWDNGPKHAESWRLNLPMQPGILTDAIIEELVAFAGLTPELAERYDLLSWGTISVNLAGWGLMCFTPERRA